MKVKLGENLLESLHTAFYEHYREHTEEPESIIINPMTFTVLDMEYVQMMSHVPERIGRPTFRGVPFYRSDDMEPGYIKIT